MRIDQTSAMNKVLMIPELLEAILLFLPMNKILQGQQIDKSFYTLINTSTRIQQALFFRPKPRSSGLTLNERLPLCVPEVDCPGYILLNLHGRVFNPLLRHFFPAWFQFEISDLSLIRWENANFDKMPFASTKKRRTAFMYPGASWRRMLVTQPHIQQLRVLEVTGGRTGDHYAIAVANLELENDGTGLRMGILYDVPFALIYEGEPFAWFNVQWNCLPNIPVSASPSFNPLLRDTKLASVVTNKKLENEDFITLWLGSAVQCCGRGRPPPLSDLRSASKTQRQLEYMVLDGQFCPGGHRFTRTY